MALIIGGLGKDTLNGTSKADQIFGLWQDDTLNGGGGNDVLFGGTGKDKLNGGEGFDTASYIASTAAVTVSLATGLGSGGEATGDHLADIEGLIGSIFGDTLSGNNANNHLYGLAGNDALSGGGGNDRIDGSLGADRLTGGVGADKFIFRPFDGKDRIIDWETSDRMDVRAHNFADFGDLMGHVSQSGASTLINFGDGDQVTLLGVVKSSLLADDFII